MKRTCEHCGQSFDARRKNAKYCSERHRVAASRARQPIADEAPSPVDLDLDAPASELETSIHRDLERAGVLDTYPAQLALQLAKRLAQPDESGIAGLSKELRTVMAAALEGSIPAAADEDDSDDEVAKARRARELKARNAAG